jgi:hypothetical protein
VLDLLGEHDVAIAIVARKRSGSIGTHGKLRHLARPGAGLNLLERRLAQSLTTVTIPLNDRVIFVGLFDCAKFSGRLSEIAQTLDAISGIQFLASG